MSPINDITNLPLHSDNVWDAEEIQAVYGVHHVYSQQKSKACLVNGTLGCLILTVSHIG